MLNTGAAWSNVRQAKNWQSNGFVGDVTSPDIRCNQLNAGGAPSTLSVAAGGTVTVNVSPNAYHPGPMQHYLAKVPAGQTAATFDGSGAVWFRIAAEQPNFGSQLTWPSTSASSFLVMATGQGLTTRRRQGHLCCHDSLVHCSWGLPHAFRTYRPSHCAECWRYESCKT